jgi:SAM-dependent methyltransferase
MDDIKLDLGCGNKRRNGFFGVDRYRCDAADLLCDITQALPFKTDSVTAVCLDNLIEHILDIPRLLAEIVRVCRDGATITIITPHFSALDSWRDPTHIHHLSYFSMDHVEDPGVRHYIGRGLRVSSRRLTFSRNLMGYIGRLIFRLSPGIYEKQFCFVFRARLLHFELRVDKSMESRLPPSTSAATVLLSKRTGAGL